MSDKPERCAGGRATRPKGQYRWATGAWHPGAPHHAQIEQWNPRLAGGIPEAEIRSMANDKPTVTIAVDGKVTSEGQLHGTGTLDVQISDASKAAVTLDYSTPDRVSLTIASEVGFSIRSKGVTLAGSAGVTPIDRSWSATGSIKLDVSKSVAMTMQQTFGSAGPSTSLGVSITF